MGGQRRQKLEESRSANRKGFWVWGCGEGEVPAVVV